MRYGGPLTVMAFLAVVGLFMAGVWVAGNEARLDYRIASKGDLERTDLALTAERVVWLEQAGRDDGAVLSYEMATRARATLAPSGAALDQPLAAHGDWVAWASRLPSGPLRVMDHDQAGGRLLAVSGPDDNVTLPGATLEDGALLVRGTYGNASAVGVWRVDLAALAAGQPGARLPLPLAAPDTAPLVLSQGRVWWAEGATLRAADARTGAPLERLDASAEVVDFAVDGDLVAWSIEEGGMWRLRYAHLGNGSRGEVSGLVGNQHGPAVDGSTVLFRQVEGLVRLKDLATGEERTLPARTQENIQLRLEGGWAAWLSGTIQGHNVLLVPLDGNA